MSMVDVVIPCYRYGHYLEHCVRSVLSQSVQDVRVLIIDDASPDSTPDVASALAREDSRVSFIHHQTNAGHIQTYNEGIDWATSPYFLLLSADDYLLHGALKRAITALEARPHASFCHGTAIESINEEHFDSFIVNCHPRSHSEDERSGLDFIRMCRLGNPVFTPTAIVRTAAQKAAGYYRVELPHSGDFEMWLRLATYGSVVKVSAPQAVYRRHSLNMSLAYYSNANFLDLVHRKAAIESFFKTASSGIPDRRQLTESFLAYLAKEAAGHASSAFNAGNSDAVEQLCEFASQANPRVTSSFPWWKLKVKRRIGLRAWRKVALWSGREIAAYSPCTSSSRGKTDRV